MKEPCKLCGKPSSHITFENGKKKRLCCKCFVQAGNPPADWHRGCMRAVGREKKTVVWDGESCTKCSSLL